MRTELLAGYCPLVHRAVELVGRRWTGAVLLALQGGASRFSDVRDAVPGLSDRLLVERLRELEAEGCVVREEQDRRTVRYRLTEKGEGLLPALDALAGWVRDWHAPPGGGAWVAPPAHLAVVGPRTGD